MTAAFAPVLDMRVTRHDVPVDEIRLMRGWFTVRRPADPAARGVELVTRIPGYLDQVTSHPRQADALAASDEIYDRYSRDVRGQA